MGVLAKSAMNSQLFLPDIILEPLSMLPQGVDQVVVKFQVIRELQRKGVGPGLHGTQAGQEETLCFGNLRGRRSGWVSQVQVQVNDIYFLTAQAPAFVCQGLGQVFATMSQVNDGHVDGWLDHGIKCGGALQRLRVYERLRQIQRKSRRQPVQRARVPLRKVYRLS